MRRELPFSVELIGVYPEQTGPDAGRLHDTSH